MADRCRYGFMCTHYLEFRSIQAYFRENTHVGVHWVLIWLERMVILSFLELTVTIVK